MILCVVGPTGVGKTKLSVMLAKKYNAIIINADACQIYKELNIGTSKIIESEKEGIKHFLIDIKNPDEDYSVSDYQLDLRELLRKYHDQNIVLVGGTGLYIKAGLYDYHFSPLKKQDYSQYSNEELYNLCLKIEPNLNIHSNNRRRLENFLNREEQPVKSLKLLYNALFIGLSTDRDTLYSRINSRVDAMFQNGLVDEVKMLMKKYPNSNILKRAIGYKEIIAYLNKEITLEEAKELIKKKSRHYAKRQYTWFNNQMNVKWFDVNFNNFLNTYEEIVDYIEGNKNGY